MENLERWIVADNKIYELKKTITDIEADIKKWESEATDAKMIIESEMRENGITEETINGSLFDYKIYFTSGRESIKIDNIDAVPDEFCKIERKPKLKEIKDHIDSGNKINWANVEIGKGKLTYKVKERK